MTTNDIHAQISNVNVVASTDGPTGLMFSNERWRSKICANEIEACIVCPTFAFVKLCCPKNSVIPRSDKPRRYFKLTYASSMCNAHTVLLSSVLANKVHDFRTFDSMYKSWGYDDMLFVKDNVCTLVYSDNFKLFTTADVAAVDVNRAGCGARTFDMELQFQDSGTCTFQNVDNSEYSNLLALFNVEENMDNDSNDSEHSESGSDWEADGSDVESEHESDYLASSSSHDEISESEYESADDESEACSECSFSSSGGDGGV